MHQLLVQAEQRTKADMELERENKRLMAELRKAKLAPGTEQIVRNMLGRWQAQRSNECHLLGMATGAGDTWRHAHASNCDLSLSKARAAALKKATACVARAAAEPSQPERALNCLEPLMPLTAGVRSKIFD